MSQENVEIVRQAEAAMNRRDAAAFKAFLAPDCEMVPLRGSLENTVYRGLDGVDDWLAAQDESWLDLSAVAESIWHERDWVLVVGRIRARGSSSGADLDVPAAAVWRLADGLITRVRLYSDPVEALKAVGLEE
jgi:ketosteroid isomerase-like protein